MRAKLPRVSYPQAGFTLIELVVVIVILGILAAVAAPRFFNDRTFMQRGYYEELASALKYAQKLAVASGCAVRFELSASGYQARQQAAQSGSCNTADTSWPTNVQLADGQVLAGSTPLGVVVSPVVTLTFDALGRTNLASDQSISIGPFALTVRADSGFVQAP
jgi:MSHA pilin protein MshC